MLPEGGGMTVCAAGLFIAVALALLSRRMIKSPELRIGWVPGEGPAPGHGCWNLIW
jgi:hypothetical protein